MLEEGSQGWAACDQLPSVTFPPKSTLDLGPQLLWLVQATDSMIPKSPSGTIYQLTRLWGICVQPMCHWQKFSCTIWHTYAHAGMWQEWLGRLRLTSLRRVNSSAVNNCWQYESLECKRHQDSLYLLQTVSHW